MKKLLLITAVATAFAVVSQSSHAQSLADGLVAYWPLDEIVGGTQTPDLINGLNMNLSAGLTESNIVPGHRGNAFHFDAADSDLLSRVHTEGEPLPANQHESFTISLWTQVAGGDQNDLRVLAECNTGDNTPLFTMGTGNAGGDQSFEMLVRRHGHVYEANPNTTATPMDGTWHHILFVQDSSNRYIYIDGVLDPVEVPDRTTNPTSGDRVDVNNTTIGGILRSAPSHYVTGDIDEVAIWNRALTTNEITEVYNNDLESIFPPLAEGLVAHWPLDEIVAGTQTPDVINGLNMNLSAGMSEANIVAGHEGNAFHFDAADSDLLSRVHAEGEPLPANQHESFTVSLWTQVAGADQNDLRVLAECNTGDNTPLFTMGTGNAGGDQSFEMLVRRHGHVYEANPNTTATPMDGTWHHILFVQDSSNRYIYIDGVLDPVEVPDRTTNPTSGDRVDVNNTTIGGILRSAPSHYVTGDIDEVAIWNRALPTNEITDLYLNGVPTVIGGGPPLNLRTFKADFPAVVSGDTVTLRWEVTGATSIEIDQGVGPVTDLTDETGVGEIAVQVDALTTFTMTASDNGDTATAVTTVQLVGQEVADGWRVIDDFETYVGAPIELQSDWVNPLGLASVLNLGQNRVLAFTETAPDVVGDGLSLFRNLNSLSVLEGTSATLFFRFFLETAGEFGLVNLNTGLADKPIQFVSQLSDDFGPWTQFQKAAGFGTPIQLAARDGVGGALSPATNEFSSGTIYNIWIDVENMPLGTQDVFSVHIAEEGAPGRITLFQDFASDRDPASGFTPVPDLNKVLMAIPQLALTPEVTWIDDIYLSSGGLNATVPVPASSFERSTGGDVEFTGYALDHVNADLTVEWSSSPGATFEVRRMEELDGAPAVLATDYPSGGATGETTSYVDTEATLGAAFYQISQLTGGTGNTIFFDDFEGTNMGWVGEAPWEVGMAGVNGPDSAYSGDYMWGTDMDADVPSGAYCALLTPLIDLTNVTSGTLTFQLWSDTAGEITVDAYNINGVPDYVLEAPILTFSGTSPGWFEVTVTLPDSGDIDLEGTGNGVFGRPIYLEFLLWDPSGGTPGLYIDDVRIWN